MLHVIIIIIIIIVIITFFTLMKGVAQGCIVAKRGPAVVQKAFMSPLLPFMPVVIIIVKINAFLSNALFSSVQLIIVIKVTQYDHGFNCYAHSLPLSVDVNSGLSCSRAIEGERGGWWWMRGGWTKFQFVAILSPWFECLMRS